MGGLLDAGTPSSEMVAALDQDAGSYTWVAATVGANTAAGYQLSTGHAVLAIGGFNGTDPSPTLEQFVAWAKAGRIHYFIGAISAGNAPGGGTGSASQIATWVAEHATATTIGTTTLYDLSSLASGS
jgi:hypothetical protein